MRKFRLHTTLRHVIGIGLALVSTNSVGFVLHSLSSSPPKLPYYARSTCTATTILAQTKNHHEEEKDEPVRNNRGYIHLDHIERVLCISDLHTDHAENMQWLANHTQSNAPIPLGPTDLVVVAGDISHDMDRLEQSLMYFLQTGASVLFVAGNHEAWLHSTELQQGTSNSTHKLAQVYQTCQELGVYTQTCLKVGGSTKLDRPKRKSLWIVPLESWYDGSLSLGECQDLCEDFGKWPWVDFLKCTWPGYDTMPFPNERIPQGLAQDLAHLNQPLLDQLPLWIANDFDDSNHDEDMDDVTIMTVSHFLPNQQCLPDWKDPTSSIFLRDEWLNHGGGGISAKFAKVAGTTLLDDQIRNHHIPLSSGSTTNRYQRQPVRRLHVFGHSHRPKDFEWNGIRYIHNPLGKPREREIHMVSPMVDFQPLWTSSEGEILGPQVIRYWEEQGGGVDALILRMNESKKKKSRYGALSPSTTTTTTSATTTSSSDMSKSPNIANNSN